MTRKQLEALGLTAEQIDSVMGINGADIEKAKGETETLKAENVKLKEDVAERDKQLETLKGVDAEALKAEIEKLQNTNKTAKAEYEAELKQVKISNAVEKALLNAGAKNAKAVKALLDLENAELDGENVKGLDKQIEALLSAEDSKFLFDVGTDDTPKISGAKPNPSGDANHTGFDVKNASYDEIAAYMAKNPNVDV